MVLLRQFVATRRPQASRAGSTPPSAAGDAAVPLPGVPVVVGEAWTKTLSAARDLLRLRRYSPKTETAYLDWSRRFAAYCGNRPPFTLAEGDVKRYLTHLAMERHVSASTQNQAFCALLFLFREVLVQPLDGLQDTVRARRGEKLPVVFSQEEVQRLLAAMEGTTKLMAQITYGAGLRLMECMRLRVKDLDLDQHRLLVRSGKGDKDRSTLLPQGLLAPLRKHLARVKELHERDLAQGHGEIRLPDALGRKYPNAGREWPWQYVFPSGGRSTSSKLACMASSSRNAAYSPCA